MPLSYCFINMRMRGGGILHEARRSCQQGSGGVINGGYLLYTGREAAHAHEHIIGQAAAETSGFDEAEWAKVLRAGVLPNAAVSE
jgi:hypothetical protein